jgi:hypothetical protein
MENMCHVSERIFIEPLPRTGHGANHIENTSSNTIYIVACAYFGCWLEMGLHVTIFITGKFTIIIIIIALIFIIITILRWYI